MTTQPNPSDDAANLTSGKTIDYDELSRWAESDAGAEAITTALSTPMTEAEQAHERDHLAIVDAIIATSTNNDKPSVHRNNVDTDTSQ